MAKPTKQNVLTCKRIKGNRAGCWLKEKGKIVFRMTSRERLKRLGIPLRTAKRGRVAITLSGGGYTLTGAGCRDSDGKFVPIDRCRFFTRKKKK